MSIRIDTSRARVFPVEGSRHKKFYNCQMLPRIDIQTREASYDYLLLFNWCEEEWLLQIIDLVYRQYETV